MVLFAMTPDRRAGGHRRNAAVAVAVVALGTGCGSRTGLDAESPAPAEDSGPPPPEGQCRVAPKPTPPIEVTIGPAVSPSSVVPPGPVLASDGCSYAAIWATQGPDTEVHAVRLRVVDGQWRSSPLVTVASVGDFLPSTWIAWTGARYVLAWTDGTSAVNLRVMSEDGTLLGDKVRAFGIPPTSYIDGLQASEDGVVRLGLSYDSTPYQSRGDYAKVTTDGRVLVAPRLVTLAGEETWGPGPGLSFVFEPGGPHHALSVNRVPSSAPNREYLVLSTFDDDGNVTASSTLTTRSLLGGLQMTSSAIAVVGVDVYGTWTTLRESASTLATYLRDVTRDTTIELVGSGPPEIVSLGSTALGILMTPPTPSSGDLGFAVLRGDTLGPRTVIASRDALAGGASYAICSGKETVAIAWSTTRSVFFTIVGQ
jgi:hypothetical protein